MLHVNFNAYNNYVTDSLYQWDINQKLNIIGLNIDVAPEIHFSNANMDRAIVRQSSLINGNVVVNIPNALLQEALRIKAYIGIYDGTTFKIIETVEIPVIGRARPYDYAFEDTDGEIYSFKALEAKINDFINENNGVVATIYDTNSNGIVDDSERLGGKLPSEYATSSQGVKADNAMPKSGGTFTGNVTGATIGGHFLGVRNMLFYANDGQMGIAENIRYIKCVDK